jgi:hypothetical protein
MTTDSSAPICYLDEIDECLLMAKNCNQQQSSRSILLKRRLLSEAGRGRSQQAGISFDPQAT